MRVPPMRASLTVLVPPTPLSAPSAAKGGGDSELAGLESLLLGTPPGPSGAPGDAQVAVAAGAAPSASGDLIGLV